ncbi:MAG TPA: prolyl oligopeptidase family serine peptidase, partial [Candidatus Bathyarchaeia archaeon]|nr:prolyl oligopeptidase family serine peptidase [Candidatus Bathyarchaeia archaeon]
YLWLENSNSADTQDWLVEQKARFERYRLSNPYTQEIKMTLQDLDDRDLPKNFVRIGEKYLFHQKNALYIQNGLEKEAQLLLDFDDIKGDSSFTLVGYVPSPNGQLVAYGLSENGSDWTTWNILDIASKQRHSEPTGKTKFSTVCWSSDSLGFYYSCFDDQSIHGVYYHRLGNTQDQDQLIYQDLNNKNYFYIPRISSDRRYLLIDIITGSMAPNSFLCLDLEHLGSSLNLIPFDGSTYWFICNRGSKFYFTTTKDASYRKLIVVDVEDPTSRQDIISEKNCLLADVVSIDNYFLVSYEEAACSKLSLFDHDGKEVRKVPLPDIGVVRFWHGHPDSHGTRDFLEGPVLFSFSNFIRPYTLYRFDLSVGEPIVSRKSQIEVDSDDYSIRQIFYSSKDGTKIPLFIAHKKDLVIDGNTPTMLYGYGAFSQPNLPVYNYMKMAWLQRGGILASASIRGGGEYGTKWHLAGVKEKKQNSIDDLLAAADWLIGNKYTSPNKLVLYGFSNSAMLTAACANQRPEMFGAIVVIGGIYDMIRYPLFSLGRFWVLEYGNPDDPTELDFIKKYSPYHNINPGIHYPSMLIMVSDMDTRVVPLHSYKYAAALQKTQAGEGEILLRVKHKAGHFADDIEDAVDMLAFIMKELRMN